MSTTNLKVWLPFDNSATEDKSGNTWTVENTSPTIINDANSVSGKACDFDGTGYIYSEPPELDTSDFTIDWWEYISSSRNSFTSEIIAIDGTTGTAKRCLEICYYQSTTPKLYLGNGTGAGWSYSEKTIGTKLRDQWVHRAVIRSGSTIYAFENGSLYTSFSCGSLSISVSGSSLFIGNFKRANRPFVGMLDEVRFYVGTALWTENFTPPNANDYAELEMALGGIFTFDVERRISNAVEVVADVERKITQKWRYYNAGDADDLILESTVLTDLPETQSKTGTAFYQTTRAKCFDLPATAEIWLKFDVYFDGSNRWRAYNGGANGTTGITAQTTGELSFFANDTHVQNSTNICTENQLQTFLLHMVSDTTAGIIEAWLDGTLIYSYTGDVNHGEDFADIYLQSDGTGTFFSNVIISNAEIGLGDGFHKISFDAERRVESRYQVSFDVERNITATVYVPLIGQHFNHFVTGLKVFSGNPQRIILPKKSSVYLCGTGIGAVKVFSDTDASGTITGTSAFVEGSMYAELEECNEVFIQSSASPQQVIGNFMHSLVETTSNGSVIFDEAINYCTNGAFTTATALINQLISDLNGSASYTEFLQDKCGIILNNADTGAITGSDAGGVSDKTAESIIPEKIPVTSWVIPARGSIKMINGLTVHFPSKGIKGRIFTAAEKHIMAGLNSVWIEQCLNLVKATYGIDFNVTSATIKDITIKFVNNDDHSLAYVQKIYSGYKIILCLFVNMHYYSEIDTASEDGLLVNSSSMYYSAGYLDRTLVHELTHAAMMATIDNFSYLPLYIREGTAEIVHGIDDLRENSIIELLTTRQSNLERILSSGGGANDGEDVYSAGYIFLRYLAKQGQAHISAPAELEIAKLLISDGVTDSSYETATNNTRQLLSNDVSRTLFKTLSVSNDVEIRDVIPVEVPLDTVRALNAKIIIFPVDNVVEPVQTGKVSLKALRKSDVTLRDGASGENDSQSSENSLEGVSNTEGIQSIEISISEQQLSDQVKFTGIVQFGILQEFSGQYFDYKYDMDVEHIRQQGILYSYDCGYNRNDILYNTLNYEVKADYDLYGIVNKKTGAVTISNDPPEKNDEDHEVFQEIHKASAILHLNQIAQAMSLSPVCSFDDFVSTMEIKQTNVTYSDLISNLFGWTSRVPHKMINVFIKEKNLYVIQRGKEPNPVDLKEAKCSQPVFEQKLIRTVTGSSVASHTQTINRHTPAHYMYPPPSGSSPDGKTSYLHMNVSGYGGIEHGYALLSAETTNDDGSRHIVEYSYDTVDGVYTCVKETARDYDAEGNEIDVRVTIHHSLTPSQQFSRMDDADGNTTGSSVGSNLPGFYCKRVILKPERETVKDVTSEYQPLIDTNFPIIAHSDAGMYESVWKSASVELHQSVQETVTFSLYDYPHIINFNDRITFNDKQYHLVSNTAKTTSRIKNEQKLTLVRWSNEQN